MREYRVGARVDVAGTSGSVYIEIWEVGDDAEELLESREAVRHFTKLFIDTQRTYRTPAETTAELQAAASSAIGDEIAQLRRDLPGAHVMRDPNMVWGL